MVSVAGSCSRSATGIALMARHRSSPNQYWPLSLYSAPFKPSRASDNGTNRAAMSARVSGCCLAQASSAWRVAWGSLAWVARLRSSSKVRGLGPVWAARCTAGCRRARHHRPKPSRVVQASISVLSCHSHRRSSSGAVMMVGVAGVSTTRLGFTATCTVRAGRLVRSR